MKKSSIVHIQSTLAAGLLAAATFLLPTSCKPIELGLYKVFDHGEKVDERADRLVTIPSPTVAPGSYSFVVVSDVHFGNSSYDRDDEAFYNVLRHLKATLDPAPCFTISLGDVVEKGGDEEEWEDYWNWCKVVEGILGNRVYTTTGNHDLYNEGWDYFEDYTYPGTGFFRFENPVNGFSFYFLDTGSGSMGTDQYDMFKNAVRKDSCPKIVSTHYPAYGTSKFFQDYYVLQNTEEADKLITLCDQENVKLYLSGHMHVHHVNDLGSFTEVVLPCYAVEHEFLIVTVHPGSNSITQVLHSY